MSEMHLTEVWFQQPMRFKGAEGLGSGGVKLHLPELERKRQHNPNIPVVSDHPKAQEVHVHIPKNGDTHVFSYAAIARRVYSGESPKLRRQRNAAERAEKVDPGAPAKAAAKTPRDVVKVTPTK